MVAPNPYNTTSVRIVVAFTIFFLFFGLEKAVAQITMVGDFEEEAFSGPVHPKPERTFREKVDISTTAMDFEAPGQLSPGWTTFRYSNNSNEPHFFVLEKMPTGKTIANTRSEIIPVFDAAMVLINEGRREEGLAELGKLPSWFSEVIFSGGPGIISPGKIAETTVNLEPGTYIIECYVKMPNGRFHSAMGMIEEIQVSGINRMNPEPKAGLNIQISNSGITFDARPQPGRHTFAVHFQEQKTHENFVGHDIHLVRLREGADLDELNTWMNWAQPEAFQTPAPAGIEFLGGIQEMPAGNTAYFTATLSPGNYALISEVPDPKSKNMLQTFTVPAVQPGAN